MIPSPVHASMAKKPIGLTTKLFVAMAVANIMLIGAMALGARISFEHVFLGYLQQQDMKRLEASTASVTAAYRAHGSWLFLQKDRTLWHLLLRPLGTASYPETGRARFPPPPLADLMGANARFVLLDADGNYLSGNPDYQDGTPRAPIQVGGKTVGWLLMIPIQKVTEAGDLRLQEAQRDASGVIAIIAILVAVLISLWLARALGIPLQRIARATHVLAGGNFQARVPTSSGGELGQLEEDFNHLAITLDRNERMRAALVADVSHELRTPLAVMRGEIEALEVGIRDINIDAIRSLSAELMRLNRLVDDLYDLSLADVGALKYYFVDVDIVDALDEVLQPIVRLLGDAGIAVNTQLPNTPCWVHGDERRLQQVFSNIFQNVLRYVSAGAYVDVICRREGAQVHIDIQDSGAGVPDASLEALFSRFYRVEGSRSRSTGGAGLGLPICRTIIEAHKGRITAAKAPQGGLWMAIMLPLRKEH